MRELLPAQRALRDCGLPPEEILRRAGVRSWIYVQRLARTGVPSFYRAERLARATGTRIEIWLRHASRPGGGPIQGRGTAERRRRTP